MQADPAVPYYPEVLQYTCAAVVRADVLMPVLLPAALKALTLAVVISGVLLQSPLAQAAAATVVSIGDGDTLRVRQEGHLLTVRLACIDAPETSQAGQRSGTVSLAVAPDTHTVAVSPCCKTR